MDEMDGEVLLLVDLENAIYSFLGLGPGGMQISERIKKLMEWVDQEIGDLLGGKGFVFAPEHMTASDRKTCVQNRLQIMICPKKKHKEKGLKSKDTVDEKLIWFGKMMLKHPGVKILVLVSGDEDFAPLFEEAQKQGIKVGLVVPTIQSVSTNKVLVGFVDPHPKNQRKMFFRLDQV
jgi:NYN domain